MKRKMFLGLTLAICALLGLLSGIVQTQAPTKAQIAFISDRDGNGEIYVMDVDGKNLRRLTNTPTYEQGPSWSPDGKKIAFYAYLNENWEICVIDADGKNYLNLTNHLSIDETPAWSPDGQKIAFSSSRSGGRSEIYVMEANGKNVRQLTQGHGDLFGAHSPAWSPDGTKIAFMVKGGICVMDADGQNIRMLTDVFAKYGDPDWSPDGREIVFVSNKDRADPNLGHKRDTNIYIMNADGSNIRRLTNHLKWDDRPVWSPDGKQILFASDRDSEFRNGLRHLYLMDVEGQNILRLTDSHKAEWGPDWVDPTFVSPVFVSPVGKLRAIWGKLKQKHFNQLK